MDKQNIEKMNNEFLKKVNNEVEKTYQNIQVKHDENEFCDLQFLVYDLNEKIAKFMQYHNTWVLLDLKEDKVFSSKVIENTDDDDFTSKKELELNKLNKEKIVTIYKTFYNFLTDFLKQKLK